MTSKEIIDILSNKLKFEEDLEGYSDKEYLKNILFDSNYSNILKEDKIGLNLIEELIGDSSSFYRDTVEDKYVFENIDAIKKELDKLNIVIYFANEQVNDNFISTDKNLKEKVSLYSGINNFLKGLING